MAGKLAAARALGLGWSWCAARRRPAGRPCRMRRARWPGCTLRPRCGACRARRHPAADGPRGGGADHHQRAHVGPRRVGQGQRGDVHPLVRPADRGGEGDGVAGGSTARSASNAAPSCQGRARDSGLYSASTKPAPAAARSRCSTVGHGLRLSDSEIAQKSWPSGAPSRAAAASRAEMPGTTSMSSAARRGGPPPPRTPPPPCRTPRDRRPTRRRPGARRRPASARAARGPARPGCPRRAAPGPAAAARGRDRGRSRPGRSRPPAPPPRRGEQRRVAGAEADDGEPPGHRGPLPPGHQHQREIRRRRRPAGWPAARCARPAWCRARRRGRARRARPRPARRGSWAGCGRPS